MMPNDSDADADAPEETDDGAIARRALLRRGVYLIPAIVGTFLVTRGALAQASCLPTVACGPDVCQPILPCTPNGSCGPDICTPARRP